VQQPSKYEVFSILQAIKQRRASTEQLARLEQFSGPAEQNLFAALNDVKISTGVGAAILQPQWIGELYKERSYQRKYASLFNHADLTSLTMSGFKWTTKPAGGTWSGDKATVPTNTPATAPVTDTASRFAGGHDIAREFKDFNVEGFFESYYAAMTDSYEQWIDQTIVLTEVLADSRDSSSVRRRHSPPETSSSDRRPQRRSTSSRASRSASRLPTWSRVASTPACSATAA
jgi:hypothetical protein